MATVPTRISCTPSRNRLPTTRSSSTNTPRVLPRSQIHTSSVQLKIAAWRLLTQLHAAKATNTYDRKLQQLARVDVIAIDDFGLRPMRSPQDEDFHELIAERYEKKPTLVTSNLAFDEWGVAFPNKLMGAATCQR